MKNYHKIIIVGYIDDLIRRFNTFVRVDSLETAKKCLLSSIERKRGLYNDN